MVKHHRTLRPGLALVMALILAGTVLCADSASAQYETWYRLPTQGNQYGTPQWLDTARVERVGATRLRVWVSHLSQFGLNAQRVDESYDRTEGLYLVDCQTGRYQLTETKYLRGDVVTRRVYISRPRWGAQTVVSEMACDHAGLERPPTP